MIKCAFDIAEDKCSALSKKSCQGCGFYKSKEKLAEGRAKAEERVNRLPGKMRKHIFDKYYAGVKPRKIDTE